MNKHKILRALSWNFIGTYGNQAVLFMVGIILARILDPEDFGIVSIILVFSSFGQILIDLGLNSAIIQDKSNTQEDLATVFCLNMGIGALLFMVLFIGSHAIAGFYNEERLINLTKFISLIFILFAFSSIQRTLIIKKVDFKSETLIIMVSSIVSGGIAITLAVKGFGVWALAVKIVLQRLFEMILYWIKGGWRPSLVFNISTIRKYFNFSMNLTAASLFRGVAQQVDRLIVGKLFSTHVLGFFDRAKRYNDIARTNLGNVFGKVMFPVFSEIQDDHEKLVRVYRKIIKGICFITLPFFFILISVARPLIVVLITDKWLPSVILLQILAVSGFTYPVSMVMVKAITALGRADIFFKLDVIKTVLYFTGIFAGALWGIIGVVVAITVVNFFGLTINAVAISKLIGLKIKNQIRDALGSFSFSVLMFAILIIFTRFVRMNDVLSMIILPLSGIVVYGLMTILFNHKLIVEMKTLLKGFMKK